MTKIEFFNQGQQMAFENGKQVPILQTPWILLFAEHAAKNGYDPTKFEIILPNGRKTKIVKTEEGYNFT